MTQHKFKTTTIKGKEYVDVSQRLQYFRSEPAFAGWSLETEIIAIDADGCVMRALAKNAEGRIMGVGFAQEDRTSSMINKTSYVENCETSAWGRCMANLGIGITPEIGIASAEEVSMAIAKQELPAAAKPAKASTQPSQEVKADFEQRMGLTSTIDDVIALENLRSKYIKLLQEYHKAGGTEHLPSSQGLPKDRLEAGIEYIQQALGQLKAFAK